ITSSNPVDHIILERGYISLYVPLYSPELNTIEAFWKVLKDRVRGDELTNTEILFSRVI
ncbi:hypothetical protein BCV72DRAFT_184540, partial [Rhizopus microsporus var. microsporus]